MTNGKRYGSPVRGAVTVTTTVLRGVGAAASVGSLAVVAAVSGPEAVGAVVATVAWTRVLGQALARGGQPYALKHASRIDGARSSGLAKSLLRRCQLPALAVMLASLPVTLIAYLAVGSVEGSAVGSAAVAAAAFGATQVLTGILIGRRDPVRAVLLEFVVPYVPILIVALISGFAGWSMHPTLAAPLQAVGFVAGFAWALWAVRPGKHGRDATVALDAAQLRTFTGSTVANVLAWNVTAVLLPLVANLTVVGQFGLAQRLVGIPALLMVGINLQYSPLLATYSQDGSLGEVRSILRRSQVWATALYLPFAVAFIVLPATVLELVYGDQARAAAIALAVMGAGQILNSGTGLAQSVANMAGMERLELGSVVSALILGALLTVTLPTFLGLTGAALAYATAVVTRNLVTYWGVRQRLREEWRSRTDL